MREHVLKPLLKTLPTLPGCYIYRGKEQEILYVGKAKNLRKRVTSYFTNYDKLVARIQIMIDLAIDLEYHVVDSEVEALILEASLIKKYKPKYNVLLKDDKSYAWIKITKEPFPAVYRTRSASDPRAIYFGPFPDSGARDQVLDFLRKEFPYRTCSYNITEEELEQRKERRARGERVRSRLCTYYHIGRCGGPCEDQVERVDYLENIDSLKKFLQNKKKIIIKDLESKMQYYAKNLEFEKAARTKKQMDELSYVSQRLLIGYGDDEDDVTRLSYQRSQKGLELLIKTLKITDLSTMAKEEKADYLDNFRMECYDISNIQGTNPVGSMVVFIGGVAKKSHYRKFKINIKETPDDFAMMYEMLTRRFRRLLQARVLETKGVEHEKITNYGNLPQVLKQQLFELAGKDALDTDKVDVDESFSAIPNLVIIDGGKGQLGKAIQALNDLKINVLPHQNELPYAFDNTTPLYLNLKVSGLAKRREEIFLPEEKESYLFDDKKEALFLLQRIRDETHRFGITYHRLRRGKAMFD